MTSESIFKRVVNSLNSQQESKYVCQNNISTIEKAEKDIQKPNKNNNLSSQ